MIKGYCETNLDDFKKKKWPDKFVAVPRKGEFVAAEDGTTLMVIRVEHFILHYAPFEPAIIVRLHSN